MSRETARILVADDDAVIREGLRRILSAEGYEVKTVSNGRAALEHLELNTDNSNILTGDGKGTSYQRFNIEITASFLKK